MGRLMLDLVSALQNDEYYLCVFLRPHIEFG